MKDFCLPNFGVIQSILPQDLYSMLLQECLDTQSKVEMVSGLSNENKEVPKHFSLPDNSTLKLTAFLKEMVGEYNKKYPNYITSIKCLDRNAPLFFKTPWINYQKENQYLPLHEHDGVLSYNIWIKIPVESIFEFSYNSIIGRNLNHRLKLNKKDEGRIMLFPSLLQHIVYPFYESNQIRISIAGNIVLKT